MDVRTSVDTGSSMRGKIIIGAFVAVALTLPLVLQGFGFAFLVRNMASVGLWIMLALGLNIVVGYAGLLDLGYIAFYAMGAYASILVGDLLVHAVGPWIGPYIFIIMLPVAALVAAMTGIALGTPVLRLRGDYLAIVTLGFGEIVRLCLLNNAFGITGGSAGLGPGKIIPTPLGLAFLKDKVDWIVGRSWEFTVSDSLYWYYVIVILVAFTVFIVNRLNNSRLGRSWTAMREDEVAAASMGINITSAKLWAFSLGALWGGLAGSAFASYQGFVSPESFTFMESVFIVCIVVLGGMGSVWGAISGAIIIQGIPELIRGLAISGVIQMSAEQQSAVSNYRYLVFGLVMVIMMAWRPQGLFPSKRRAAELVPESEEIGNEESETLYDAEHGTGTYQDH